HQPATIADLWLGCDVWARGQELAERPLHVGVGEAGKGVETRDLRDVGGDVEAAREIVEEERRDARDEHAAHRAGPGAGLEGPVEGPHKARARDGGFVQLIGAACKKAIYKVVILVNEHIKLVARRAHDAHQLADETLGVLVALKALLDAAKVR